MEKKEDVYYQAEGVIVRGEVEIGNASSLWYNAVVRGDMSPIRIGRNSNVQDNAVIHTDVSFDVAIGDNVTVGHGAILHGCHIGNDSLIGMGAIVLNGARIGKNCLIGAGALVTQNTIIADGSVVLGSPAKCVRKVTDDEITGILQNAQSYVEHARQSLEKVVIKTPADSHTALQD